MGATAVLELTAVLRHLGHLLLHALLRHVVLLLHLLLPQEVGAGRGAAP